MSNFMHKVKDAVTDDHDKSTAHSSKDSNHDKHGSSNPFTMGHGPNQYSSSGLNPRPGYGTGTHHNSKPDDSRNTDNSTKTGVGNKGPGTASDTSGSTAMGGDSSTKAGSSEINAGPHDSKMANKMDPRVDNDQDNRPKNAGTIGSENTSGGVHGFDPSNTASIEQPHTHGSDSHEASEDNYSNSKQEHKSHSQPSTDGSNKPITSEDSYSSSTQEIKSHSTTSHAMPAGQT